MTGKSGIRDAVRIFSLSEHLLMVSEENNNFLKVFGSFKKRSTSRTLVKIVSGYTDNF